ncbi:MAG: hypothetical protein ACHQZQ_00220 [SAR324 cluster bacterium]
MATMKALTQAGVPQAQAETMATLDEQHAADAVDHIAVVLEARFAGLHADIQASRADIQASRADFHATVRQQTWAIIAFGFAVAGVAVTIATLLHK